jgi:alpha-ketoglutarate-dependent taurine dioxygenase
VKPVDPNAFEALARELKSVSQNFIAEQANQSDFPAPKPHKTVHAKTFAEDLASDDIPF